MDSDFLDEFDDDDDLPGARADIALDVDAEIVDEELREKIFFWPSKKRRLFAAAQSAPEHLPPPANARRSLAMSHMGAAVMGPAAHPEAHLLDKMDTPTCQAAFDQMLKKLWPAHVDMPDALSKRLLFETAVRNCVRLISEREKAVHKKWKFDRAALHVDLIEEIQKMPIDKLFQRVFGKEKF